MGRFEAKYTDEQREWIVAAKLDHELTAPQVVEVAAEGGLGIAPFAPTEASVYRFARAEQKRRQREQFGGLVEQEPLSAVEDMTRRQIALVDRALTELDSLPAEKINIGQLNELIRCTGYIAKSLKTLGPPSPRAGPVPVPERPETAFLEALEEAHASSGNGVTEPDGESEALSHEQNGGDNQAKRQSSAAQVLAEIGVIRPSPGQALD